MPLTIVAVLLLALLASVVPVAAQSPGPGSTDLQTEISRKRHIVRPPIDPATVIRDTDEAVAGVTPRLPSDAIARGLNETLIRRPDVDYDVRQGISQRNIGNAIRGR